MATHQTGEREYPTEPECPRVIPNAPRSISEPTGPTFHGPQFGISKDRLREAVNASCTCGGKPLGHGCCPACEVWHRLKS